LSEVVIRVENLGKRYRIQHRQQRQRYVALRDVLADQTKSMARRLWSVVRGPWSRSPVVHSPSQEDFWALRDISFDVKQGDSLGIIGRNGAGKSTLLKILSRITVPTEGRFRMRGRIASLLEVGTGFHPELTGRENIFLNGAILGMSRAEIGRQFDAIVAFAGIEKFLDTPVKRYSSGMYIRLAFAVAAHVHSEILIVDEVLAVGDVQFQKKCLDKMGEAAHTGRTVLFVSHNMGALAALCQQGVLLEAGTVRAYGAIQECIRLYLSHDERPGDSLLDNCRRSPGLKAVLSRIRVTSPGTQAPGIIPCGGMAEFRFVLHNVADRTVRIAFTIYNCLGVRVCHFDSGIASFLANADLHHHCLSCEVTALGLVPGNYSINVAVYDGMALLDHVSEAVDLQVVDSNYLGNGKLPDAANGLVVFPHRWASAAKI